ncbi:MAG: hypothetical protein AB7F89_11715 [Pirellulaceae bacterium]
MKIDISPTDAHAFDISPTEAAGFDISPTAPRVSMVYTPFFDGLHTKFRWFAHRPILIHK